MSDLHYLIIRGFFPSTEHLTWVPEHGTVSTCMEIKIWQWNRSDFLEKDQRLKCNCLMTFKEKKVKKCVCSCIHLSLA